MSSARLRWFYRRPALLTAIVLSLGVAARATHSEAPPARSISETREWKDVSERPRLLLHQEAWDQLEALAQDYRNPRVRLRRGRWKLVAFYDGFWPDEAEANAPRDWTALLRRLDAWREARARSVTALNALAAAYIGYAWEARGTSYADAVESAGWRLFAERLAIARKHLEAAEALGSHDPHTYVLLLRLARAQGWDRPQRKRVLEKALRLAPGYHEIYFEEIADLLPRWHGEPGDIARFAEYAVTRCQDEGEGIYARIVWQATGQYKESFQEHKFSWPRAQRGFEILLRLYPNSRANLNGYCRVACLAGDRATAVRLFERIGEDWAEQAWDGEADYLRWRRWARTAR